MSTTSFHPFCRFLLPAGLVPTSSVPVRNRREVSGIPKGASASFSSLPPIGDRPARRDADKEQTERPVPGVDSRFLREQALG